MDFRSCVTFLNTASRLHRLRSITGVKLKITVLMVCQKLALGEVYCLVCKIRVIEIDET